MLQNDNLIFELDELDRSIIQLLQRDARMSFLEISRKLLVSGGTIHQRVERLKKAGVITGSTIIVDQKKIGLSVTTLLGLHLKNAKAISMVIKKLEKFKEVLEIYYTTGKYGLIIKVATKDIDTLHNFLVKKIQMIEEIQATESFICLNTPLIRQAKPQ